VGTFVSASKARLLLFVFGAVDLAPQRRRALTQAIGERRVAAVVDSVIGRGMIVALGWSGISIHSYPVSRIRDAIASLDPEIEGESVDQCLDLAARLLAASDRSGELRDRLPPSSLLRPAI
jgi:hypothetical protein